MAQNKWILLIVLCFSVASAAVDISFPQEELPNEAFPPKTDSPQAVITRIVSIENRFEPHISYGFLLDEPFYQNSYLAAGLTYSWSEMDSATLRLLSWGKGLTDYANQFSKTAANLQFGRASGPESGITLAYNSRLLYGKVSFSKGLVRPAALAVVYEAGMIKYGSKTLPLAGVGVINSIYLTKKLSFDIGLRLFYRMYLDPLSADLRSASPAPAESTFKNKARFSTSLDFGLKYLF